VAKKSKKLPKKIAGVKVPKELRKAGGKLAQARRTAGGARDRFGRAGGGARLRKESRQGSQESRLEAGGEVAESAGWVSAALGCARSKRPPHRRGADDGKGGNSAKVVKGRGREQDGGGSRH
jgi:hypothetical protein